LLVKKQSDIDEPIHWGSEISPNGLYKKDSFTYDYFDRFNYYKVFITNLQTGQSKRIYSGDFHTLGTTWVADNSVKISYDCGTGCLATKIINTNESVSATEGEISEKNNWEIKFFDSY
jgi:hypothetical protein